jgi:DNA-binding LacI/PurR family transcriptional regulator
MTIREFANAIGVSPTTVSRALSGNGRLSSATRRMVLDRMQELGYTPNLNAQRLSQGRTFMVALDFGPRRDYLSDMFFMELTREFQETLEAQGYGLLLSGPGDVLNRWVKTQAVDGVIVVTGGPKEETLPRNIAQTGTPCVVIGHYPFDGIQGVGSIVVGLKNGAQQVAQLLVENGHRRIGFIGSDEPDLALFEFRAELERLGMTLPEHYVVIAGHTPRDGARALREFMAQDAAPTALFARTDGLAMGALLAAHQMGVQVPDELSIIGHDDVPFADLTVPQLTTVRVDCNELARQATRRLFALLSNPAAVYAPNTVNTRLVMRSTVSTPRSGAN